MSTRFSHIFTFLFVLLTGFCIFASVKVDKSGSRARLSTSELLEKHGLDEVSDQFAEFIEMFDFSTHFFSRLNNDEQFDVLNLVVDAWKRSYLRTIDEFDKAKDKPSGPITPQLMGTFLERQESHLKGLLEKDSRVLDSEWSRFLGNLHLVFSGLNSLYGLAYESDLSLHWWMLLLTPSFVKAIPSDLFDRGVFGEVLHMPLALKDSIHEILEHIMQSDYAPLIKLVSNMAAKYDWSKLLGGDEHEEL